jgi:ribosomal protein S18 acetylase RimI-like enzyme
MEDLMNPSVKTAIASDEAAAISTIVLAFGADPMARWSWADPQQYLTTFPRFAKAFGGKAFDLGSAYFTEGYTGVALWLPPDVHPDEETMGALLQSTVPDQTLKDAFAVLEKMGRYHPTEPHWYLPLIGVDPAQQSRGLGSALMKHALARCDRDRQLAYLESTNPANVPLYERHGFELLGTIQVGSSPPMFPMLRKPR